MNTDIRKYHFNQWVVKYSSSLPEDAISAKDAWEFESKLDKHWAGQHLLYDDYKADIIF